MLEVELTLVKFVSAVPFQVAELTKGIFVVTFTNINRLLPPLLLKDQVKTLALAVVAVPVIFTKAGAKEFGVNVALGVMVRV